VEKGSARKGEKVVLALYAMLTVASSSTTPSVGLKIVPPKLTINPSEQTNPLKQVPTISSSADKPSGKRKETPLPLSHSISNPSTEG
jgi:hypothetical protein